jgi:hypothetical protein
MMEPQSTKPNRIRLQRAAGDQWVLFVDQKSIITTHDRGWLEQVAAQLQQKMSAEIPAEIPDGPLLER